MSQIEYESGMPEAIQGSQGEDTLNQEAHPWEHLFLDPLFSGSDPVRRCLIEGYTAQLRGDEAGSRDGLIKALAVQQALETDFWGINREYVQVGDVEVSEDGTSATVRVIYDQDRESVQTISLK